MECVYFIFKAFRVILSYSQNGLITYKIFKAYKKLIKIFFIIFFLYINMTNRYQMHEERLEKEAREKYQNLLEKKKDKRQKNACKRYQNFTAEEKDKRRNKNLSEKKKKNLLTIDKFII